ncbi:HMG1/2-like protein [Actinidia chinensis var. chinensis]|uniref:HMG1/2-like protein n=1 Tax=Actinidia chinensis var. chinensis TaxID=1590841 RepID=A0A2R6PBI0_ACTCC|nr:HMG1/2-like protein [Actinidia chinensis var. chinensis]
MKGRKSKAKTKKIETKLSVKKRDAGSEKARNKSMKKGKLANKPNKPKRLANAFFVFMFSIPQHSKEKVSMISQPLQMTSY